VNPNRKSLKAARLAADVKRAIAEVGRGQRGEGLTVLGAVRAQITHAAQVQWDALINRRDVFPSTPTAAPLSNTDEAVARGFAAATGDFCPHKSVGMCAACEEKAHMIAEGWLDTPEALEEKLA
jgi:hypothetical protein